MELGKQPVLAAVGTAADNVPHTFGAVAEVYDGLPAFGIQSKERFFDPQRHTWMILPGKYPESEKGKIERRVWGYRRA